MSFFSETFNFIRQQHDLKIINVSEVSGIDLTTLYHWSSGNRVPLSIDQVYQLTDSLKLSLKEQNSLVQSYMKTLFGKVTFERFQSVFLLHQYAHQEYESTEPFRWNVETPHIKKEPFFHRLHSNTAASMALLQLINEASADDVIYLKIVPPYDEIMSFLSNNRVIYANKKMEIILICPEKNPFNVQISPYVYQKIFELFIHSHSLKFYLSKEPLNEFEAHANHIFTRESIIQIDSNLQGGLYTNYREWIELRKHSYEYIRSHAEFFGYYNDFMDLEKLAPDLDKKYIYTMIFQSGLSGFIGKDLIKNTLTEENSGNYIYLEIMNNFADKVYKTSSAIHMVCSENGIRKFMETGTVSAPPYSVLKPIGVLSRISILKKLISYAQSENAKYYIIKSPKNSFFSAMKFVVIKDKEISSKSKADTNQQLGKTTVILQFLSKDNEPRLVYITNPLFTCYFEDFFKVLPHSHYCYSNAETIQIMQKILKEYE